ncbi:AAA family ATPase [Gordonia paraffinivorans]|uniref:AAA family ATPase n=1 Tax=Gordonia paraffinivorans TaxID=175628 RepID=UPI001C92E1BC|nr:AAA family ATPase [Gordonia paraffinivorans]
MTDPISTRRLVLRKASEIRDDVPDWVWTYGDRGRIARGTVALFAGRPGAGKSTAARWFAAHATQGALEGCWHGQPTNVAYIAREEAVEFIVKPSLRAHGADLDRVFFPEVEVTTETLGQEVLPVTVGDMDALTDALIAAGVGLVIVDPLMALAGAKTDINRNNEVRAVLDPWRRLAEAINGVVIGVAHLNKTGNGDVVAGINGSSAFGEIARAVFGFAKDPNDEDGGRVMSQEKNSLGDESLALRYAIQSTEVRTDSGRVAELGRFVILGDSDRTVGEVLRDAARPDDADEGTERAAAKAWLAERLGTGVHDSGEVKQDARAAGFSERTLQRARRELGVTITPAGRRSTWSLPTCATDALHGTRGTGGTGGTGQKTPGQSAIREPMPLVPPVPGSTREAPVARIAVRCSVCGETMAFGEDIAAGHHISCREEAL